MTHEPDEAIMLGGECGILEQGAIRVKGDVESIVDYYLRSAKTTGTEQ